MNRKYEIIWRFSLLVIVIVTLIWVGSNLLNTNLPDIVVRIMGIIDFIAIPILVYSIVKKREK